MRSSTLQKVFYLCAVFMIFFFIYMSVRNNVLEQNALLTQNLVEMKHIEKILKDNGYDSEVKKPDIKYILQWTSPRNVPFVYMGVGQQGFIERKCPYVNCFVTSNRTYFDDYTKFDLIAFSGPEVVRFNKQSLPSKRSPHQKFVFASIESADNYPVCSNKLDGFFNWTWTYKLDSEAKWGYVVVRDSNGQIIGPKREMHWMKLEDMKPVSNEFKEQLKSKTKAAAWFVSNCYSRSGREKFVKELQQELNTKYNLTIDIYGKCGVLKCKADDTNKCDNMIKSDYYFYLSFENSFSEDYVTEKLLHGLKYNAIPIVYGAANYSRFMPDGIYLNARELGVGNLAKKMDELIRDPAQYAEYFRWKDYYSYYRRYESLETDDYCRFCSILNEENLVKEVTMYQNFRQWWDPPNRC